MNKLDQISKNHLDRCYEKLQSVYNLSKDYNKERVLIVDDEPFNCEILKQMLQVSEFVDFEDRVDICYGGNKALKCMADNIYEDKRLKSRQSMRSKQNS